MRAIKSLRLVALSLALALGAGGCAAVNTAMAPTTTATGEAWFTTTVGIPGWLAFSTHVYYCPKPGGAGPIQCKEAKYVEAPTPAK